MFNLLIIDDEEPVREAIRILGQWAELGIGQLFEAMDGRSGLALIGQEKIDLVLVDMKMPEMDGVEFLQIAERDHPNLLAIVISGYNDFEFTRQAIRSKVVDYLLKPINRLDLNQALRKAIDLLEAKRRSESDFINKNITLNMSLPKLKEKIYLSIIERSFKKHTNEALLPLIGADLPGNQFSAVVLRIMNLEHVCKVRFNQDMNLLHFAVANVMNEISDNELQCFCFASPKLDREMIAVYTMKGGYPEDLAFRADRLTRKSTATLKELFGMLVSVGMGKPCNDAMDIAVSYETAKAAILSISFQKLNDGIVTTKAEKKIIREKYSIAGRMPMIRGALETGNLTHAKKVLEDYTKQMHDSEPFTLEDADRAIYEFVFLLNDLALALCVQEERLPMAGEGELRENGITTDFINFNQFTNVLQHILEFYSNQIRQSAAAHRPFYVGDIKEYIDSRYFEDIKISTFSEKYFMSREYLMKLFKQEYGLGIHEYVQKVRMEKAKELLDDTQLKIQEISEMLGFKDKNYFSKAFRNYYSISPSEYRIKP